VAGSAPRGRPAVSKKKAPPPPTEERPFNAAFAGLASLRDTLPPDERREPARAPAPKGPSRAVVRYERKGRGGKEATVGGAPLLSRRGRAEWLRPMKQSGGWGGMLGGGALVLRGDQRARVRAWLEARGVPRISVG